MRELAIHIATCLLMYIFRILNLHNHIQLYAMFVYLMYTDALDKWEAPPISHVSRELMKVHGLITQQKVAMEQVMKELHNIRFAAAL